MLCQLVLLLDLKKMMCAEDLVCGTHQISAHIIFFFRACAWGDRESVPVVDSMMVWR